VIIQPLNGYGQHIHEAAQGDGLSWEVDGLAALGDEFGVFTDEHLRSPLCSTSVSAGIAAGKLRGALLGGALALAGQLLAAGGLPDVVVGDGAADGRLGGAKVGGELGMLQPSSSSACRHACRSAKPRRLACWSRRRCWLSVTVKPLLRTRQPGKRAAGVAHALGVPGAPPLREICSAEVSMGDQRTGVGWGVQAHGKR
jgi:hypothetical protein